MEKENYCSYLYSEINECCKAPHRHINFLIAEQIVIIVM